MEKNNDGKSNEIAKWRNHEKIWAIGSAVSMKAQKPLDMVKLHDG
jgi:hypothetical protein